MITAAKLYRGLSLCFLLLSLNACTNTRYVQDYKSDTDFSQLKTYSWRAVSIDLAGMDHAFMQRLANEQLQAKGFKLASKHPDFLVDMHIFKRVSTGGNTNIGIGLGLPIGHNGSFGIGTGHTIGRGKQEGVVVVDITQASNNTLIWRGNAEGVPLINFNLKAEHKLRESFAKLLMHFPPQASVSQ